MEDIRLYFGSDYQEGAHPNIIEKLVETNLYHTVGYGHDEYSESALKRIQEACACPDAMVRFLIGGTQTNATMIDALTRSYDGVLSADSGHVNVHEAGAVEFTGHKVLPLRSRFGKIDAAGIEQYLRDFFNDANHDHMVQPGMVYLSQPTEFGTMYSLQELSDISEVCHRYRIPLFVDGARLAYALASPENDVRLPDLARLCDAFYIGGTKCGALFGEAVVVPDPGRIPHFETFIKQHGALLAKGRILGIQFDELFRDDLYSRIGKNALVCAGEIKKALEENGYQLYFDSPTNQVFFIIENEKLEALAARVEYGFMEKYDDRRSVIRFCTSWATTAEETEKLIRVIEDLASSR